jgi:alpha-beta hydrolase superfamily lysophospholipase
MTTRIVTDAPRLRKDEGITLRSCCSGKYGNHLLRSLRLLPSGKPTAIAIFVHGVFQHSRAVELEDLQKRMTGIGCAWFGLDAPGHGMSGQLGDANHPLAPVLVPDMDAYVTDLNFFITSVVDDPQYASLPVVVLSHSWGTALAIKLLPALQEKLGSRLRGACFSSTSALPKELPDPKALSCWKMIELYAKALLDPEGFPPGSGNLDISKTIKDPSIREQCAGDKLRYKSGERPFLSALQWRLSDVYKQAGLSVPQIVLPMVIHTGASDKAVSPLCGLNLYTESKTPTAQKSFTLIPEGGHNLFGDLRRGDLMDAWCKFVSKAIAGDFLSKSHTV